MASEPEHFSIRKDSKEGKSVKILIVGDFGIGKTTLIKTYLDLGSIPVDEENTFEEYRARIKYNGNEVDVRLFDLRPSTSAIERRECYPEGVNAILICFSIGHYESLKGAYNLWIHETRAHYGNLVPIFLVGLKSDLRLLKDLSNPPKFRIVEKFEAEIIHKNYHFYGDYMECTMHDRMTTVSVINKAFFAAMAE